MKEAILYDKLANNQVRCNVCAHNCNISENQRGVCGVRENQNGKLTSLVYDKIISESADPIEKKPLFHFLPGTNTYSYATVGCNLRCDNCQNWQISQYPKIKTSEIAGQQIKPEHIIDSAVKENCQSVAATYTEPTIFVELALDVMKLAKKKGLKNIWVSNGFMSKKTLDTIIPYLDAINIDFKFFSDTLYKKHCGAKLEPILENLKYLKSKNVWLEITTLIIPELSNQANTFEKISQFIYKELGAETPWHVSRFSPEISYKLQSLPPTPVSDIEKAITIGKETGLKYIYGGNVWEQDLENTHCPECQEVVINRRNYQTINLFNKDGMCPKCNTKLDIIL